MAETPASDNELDPTDIELSVVARITFYKAGTSKNKRATKDVKAKTFNHKFSASKENYLELLTTILEKHYINNKFKVTSRNVYPCKIQVYPAKQADAPDIVNYEEYEELVKQKILSTPAKPVVIFIEMPSIEKSAKKVKQNDQDGGSSSEDEGAASEDNPGLSKEEYELAKERTKLEKKYQNDHDAGYTYIDPTGISIPLTPFMMKEWARALVDKDKNVSLENPPYTQTFDPATRKSSLLTRKPSESSGSSGTEVSSETSTLAALSGIINSIASLVHPSNQPPPTTPQKTCTDDSHDLKPSPSQLVRFLAYAEKDAGIRNASQHHDSLAFEGYGPDILHLVDDKSLSAIGIPAGDVLRLKKAAPLWWKSEPERALKRSHEAPVDQETPPNKKMRFEKRFPEGGSLTTFGPGTTEGDVDPDADFTWYFYSKDLKMTLPLPRGVVPILEDDKVENAGWY